MTIKTRFLVLALLACSTVMASVMAAEPSHKSFQAEYHPDRLLVTLHDGHAVLQGDVVSSAQVVVESHPRSLLQRARQFDHVPRQAVVQRPTGQTLEQAMQALTALPEVRLVERDYRLRKTQQPNDPSYHEQWYLQALPGIQAEQAWQYTTGDPNLVVAVIDSGIDYDHPDLRDNIWHNPHEQDNGQDDTGNGYIDDIHGINTAGGTSDPMDDDGHGTLVAGIIAASGNNNRGIAGVNWQLQLLACKFLDEEGDGFTSDAIECLDYVLDLKVNRGIPIVASNNSWGSPQFSQSLYQAVQAHHEAGILFIASAGNSGQALPFYPAAFDLPNVISVTAHDQQGQRADFANFGRQHVALSAPGVVILSTYLNNQYATSSGTSMAAPVVAGVAALIKAAEPGADAQQIRSRLLVGGSTATDPLLHNYIMTGQLALAADGAGGGAVDCQQQQLLRRLAPETDIVYAEPGSWIDIKVMALDCHGPVELPDVVVSETMEILSLNDEGQAQDAHSVDGIYSGRWFFSGTAAELNFPDGAVQVQVRQSDYCSEMNITELSTSACDALVELYYQTSGPGWFERTGWLQDDQPCSWFGVQCQAGQVIGLDLASNNLAGSLPSSLYSLTSLQQLNLSQNSLTGAFPEKVSQLTALTRLQLASNSFSGTLPESLSELTLLRSLDLADNPLQGRLPNSLTALTLLDMFDYQDTSLCEPRNEGYYIWLQAIELLSVNEDCPNQAPVVSAGAARTVAAGTQVTLQATATDPDGESLSVQWEQIAGPIVSLAAADTLQPNFTSPSPSQTVTLRFRFTASDLRTSSEDTVSITVQAATTTPQPSSSGGAIFWLWPCFMLIWIGRVWRDRVYSAS